MHKIGILSAHEGGSYWPRLVSAIKSYQDIDFIPLYAFSDAEYRAAKSFMSRTLLRVKTFILYPLYCFIQMLKQDNFDAFIVVTSPFYLPALCTLLSRKPVISLQNDIYPEALIQAKIIKRDSKLEKILRNICGYGVKKAKAVVYLCNGHKELAEKSFGVNDATYVIPVGANGTPFLDHKPELANSAVHFLYCGTLGLMHDASTIEQYLSHKDLPPDCRLEFFTSGAGKARFENSIRKFIPNLLECRTVILGDSLAESEWVSKMKSAEVGMVFQGKGAENVVFPSKVFSILVAGQAVLAIASSSSELGKMIIDHDCGWVIEPGDVDALSAAFTESTDSAILLRKRTNAFALGQGFFDVSKLSAVWHDLLLRACSE